jgi:thiol:disulfide interchange protein DsbD
VKAPGHINRLILLACALLACLTAYAARDVKRPEEVFQYTVRMDGDDVLINWNIADGYYLYRDKMRFSAKDAELGTPVYPAGEIHSDEFFGEQIIFRGSIDIRVPLLRAPENSTRLELLIRSQGCADYGLCYPPQDWSASIDLPINRSKAAAKLSAAQAALAGGKNSLPGILGGGSGTAGSDEPLPQELAFVPTLSTADPFTLLLHWDIEPGYYLYRQNFAFSNPGNEIQLGTPQFPAGVMEVDAEFGETEVYFDAVDIRIPLSRATPDPLAVELAVTYQGCKVDSICYPPNTVLLPIDLPQATANSAVEAPDSPPVSEQDRLAGVITDAGLITIMLIFAGLGLLLAFTPCCLPMVPILSGIIAGQGSNVTTRKAFALSVSYVLGMAFTYTAAGALFGAAGGQIQAALQTPLIISGVAVLFVVLSLAMFGVYELQLPAALQTRLAALGNKGKAGSFIGTAIMGAVSALVVSACVAPPLVAALAVIAQTGDVARGAFALFSLSIGMGIPLIIFGTSAGKLLPKAGSWMNTVKGVFGFMLLGLAIWMLDRILPGTVIMLLTAGLALFAGVWAGAFAALGKPSSKRELAGKVAGLTLIVYGIALLTGALSGSTSILQPLNRITGNQAAHEAGLPFARIKTVADFDTALAQAAANKQTLMLDFYADWCVSCKEMEAFTFTDQRVHAALANSVLLQADVTANDAADKALLERFGIYGPPTIIFFDREGNELQGRRVIGYMNSSDFIEHLDYVLR